jgi:hypothetical protein
MKRKPKTPLAEQVRAYFIATDSADGMTPVTLLSLARFDYGEEAVTAEIDRQIAENEKPLRESQAAYVRAFYAKHAVVS